MIHVLNRVLNIGFVHFFVNNIRFHSKLRMMTVYTILAHSHQMTCIICPSLHIVVPKQIYNQHSLQSCETFFFYYLCHIKICVPSTHKGTNRSTEVYWTQVFDEYKMCFVVFVTFGVVMLLERNIILCKDVQILSSECSD